MTDLNTVPFTPGSGGNLATDNIAQSIGSVDVPISKLLVGDKGVNDGLVSAANPLPLKVMVQDELGAYVEAGGIYSGLPLNVYVSNSTVLDCNIVSSSGALNVQFARASTFWAPSSAGTNDTSIVAGTLTITSIVAFNASASPVYLKLYNTNVAPVVGTDYPEITLAIPSLGHITVPMETVFDNGIGIGITTGAADNDTGGVGANDVKFTISWR